MADQQQVIGVASLGAAAVMAVVCVVGSMTALRSGSWVVASSAAVLGVAALGQWAAVRARRSGGRLSTGSVALLLVLGAAALVLCGVDFVTGDRSNRGFTVLFAAALIAVVGGVLGRYQWPSRRDDLSGPRRRPAGG